MAFLNKHHFRVDLVSQETNRALFNELQPIIEKWVNHPLEPNSAYGFKRYMRGSHLSEHIDIPGTDSHINAGDAFN